MDSTREGFSLIEVVVAMVLLAIILTSLAGFTFVTARQAITVSDANAREAVLHATVNRYSGLPWDSLQSRCANVSFHADSTMDRFRWCADVTADTRRAVINITVEPLQRDAATSAARIVRAAPPPPSPLCISGNCSP
ncbi:MAG TPA: prepilin-type N-terminal cleavage/methylation domain-containing protein [Longimicrobiales bacterium]|nr:prepilin-type N-terminal cleavage/methylation domain-containing protein [Longimicrobiales bacterium]